MKKIPFYIMTNALYEISLNAYIKKIKNSILKAEWFRDACKEKNIEVFYLCKKFSTKGSLDYYVKFLEENKLYAHKLLLIKFRYKQLKNNNHIKLLNINLKNETLFLFSSLLFELQNKFLLSNHYRDLLTLQTKELIHVYKERYGLYIDASLISKILKNNTILIGEKKYYLSILFPKKSFIYSLYIKDIINKKTLNMSDANIAKELEQEHGFVLSRRNICFIRKRYFIPNIYNREDINFYALNEKCFSQGEFLIKENISQLSHNLKGIYELSTDLELNYQLAKSQTVYIGSSKNIKNRLSTYLSNNGHTLQIREYLLTNKIYFRLIATTNYKEYEMLFLNGFIALHGDLPLLNKQRIKQ